ncbi:MAG: chloramphenicol resistance protein [Ruminococcus sp.]|nr:chloramphenicol resistance protein [Ruminococcus sp.]
MKKPIIEGVRDFVLGFPELKDGCLTVDCLGCEPVEYTVETVPCDPVHTRYVDGDCLKQFLFIFASREYFGADVNTAIGNLSFYEEFENWISQKNLCGELPDLGGGRSPDSIEVLTRGYALSEEADTARYQIQLRLLYEEEFTEKYIVKG